MKLDKWQEDVLNTDGNIVLRSGRQVGKSTVISIKAARRAVSVEKQSIMIISSTERQAYLLFSKVLGYLHDNHRNMIKMGKDKPTKSEIKLKNGSIIRCLPTGLDGLGIRGYTVDLLIADEAAFIPEDVYVSTIPSMLTRGMQLILLSTPFGREGFFYNCFSDPTFTSFHVTSEEVAQTRDEPMRTRMLNFLENEKKVRSQLQYAQEYLGEFVDELRQYFSDEMIKQCCILKRGDKISSGDCFLGVDIARMGDDESTFEILRKKDKRCYHVESIITRKTFTTDTEKKIIELESKWNFTKIGVDAGSGTLGVSVYDHLIEQPETKRKLEKMNNRALVTDRQGKERQKLMKEDYYDNLRAMMQRGEILLLDDDEVQASLKSVQYELDETKTKMRIFGNYTHVVEGLIRAAWLARKHKGLNFHIDYV